MTFLISNDDGVFAPGLLALYRALSRIGKVVVVAPATEQSGSASALHITQPLNAQTLDSGFVAVNGSPADCVYLALHELFADTTFDAVITGINSGANLGQDVMFSGTFGAALTAQLFGVPAIATSLVGGAHSRYDQKDNQKDDLKEGQDDAQRAYDKAAAQITSLLVDTDILARLKGLPYHVLNVNIPAGDIYGRKITRLGHCPIKRPVHAITDPRGRNAYWLSLRKEEHKLTQPVSAHGQDETAQLQAAQAQMPTTTLTDDQAIKTGYVSLSPVRLHHTSQAVIETFSALAL